MPEVLAGLFGEAGEELAAWLPLRRLDPAYRLAFPDGSHLDVVPEAEVMAERVRELCGPAAAGRYLAYRRRLGELFALAWPAFVDADTARLRSMLRPWTLLRLAVLGGFRRLDRLAAAHLPDDRLVRAHTFQAMYVGLPPHRALGVYAVVAYMDLVGGVYFPERGGMAAIPAALAALAEKNGRAVPVRRAGRPRGDRRRRRARGAARRRAALPARQVVVACDLPAAHASGLLPAAAADWGCAAPASPPPAW